MILRTLNRSLLESEKGLRALWRGDFLPRHHLYPNPYFRVIGRKVPSFLPSHLYHLFNREYIFQMYINFCKYNLLFKIVYKFLHV